MNKNQKLVIGIALGVVCGVVLRSAFSKSTKADGLADSPLLASVAQNNAPETQGAAPAVTTTQPATTAPTTAAAPQTAPAATDNAGKPTIPPDGKETVGKETVGKEVLPPVGETIGVAPEVISLLNAGPPPEYLGKPSPNSPLLVPGSPVNVSGTVVSPETK